MHAGLIGPGLLAAACPGEVFASPSANAVEAAIAAVDGGAGVAADRQELHRRRAQLPARRRPRAARSGHRVETVLVADDIALDGPRRRRRTRSRASAAAGSRARSSSRRSAERRPKRAPTWRPLAALGRRVAAATRSIGVSVSGVTLPAGGVAAITLAAGEQEFGVGIHGEAGTRARRRPARRSPRRPDVRRAAGRSGDPGPATTCCSTRTGSAGSPAWNCQRVHGYAVRHLQEAGLATSAGRWLPRW